MVNLKNFAKLTLLFHALLHLLFFQVYESGFITFDKEVVNDNCPPSPRDFGMLDQTVVAVYWIPAQVKPHSGSEIFFRMALRSEKNNEKNNFNFNKTEVDGFVAEINTARNISDKRNLDTQTRKLKSDDIQSVIYITWVNLQPLDGILADVSIQI